MIKEKYKNINLLNYFELVSFYKENNTNKIKYLLYFVTIISGLRKNMTAEIISHRLRDHDTILSEDGVNKILTENERIFKISPVKDLRDRETGEISYEITQEEQVKLKKEVNIKSLHINYLKKPQTVITFSITGIALLILLSIIGYHLASNANGSNISWEVYKNRINLNNAEIEEKALFFLYFITEHVEFRNDMTVEVINNRLYDLGYEDSNEKDIESYFITNNKYISKSYDRKNAFILTQEGKDFVFSKLNLELPEYITLNWIFNHMPPEGIWGLLVALFTIIGLSYTIGHLLGKSSKIE